MESTLSSSALEDYRAGGGRGANVNENTRKIYFAGSKKRGGGEEEAEANKRLPGRRFSREARGEGGRGRRGERKRKFAGKMFIKSTRGAGVLGGLAVKYKREVAGDHTRASADAPHRSATTRKPDSFAGHPEDGGSRTQD